MTYTYEDWCRFVCSDKQTPVDERHYRVAELAKLWRRSPQFVTRLFEDQAGVMRLGSRYGRVTGTRGNRKHSRRHLTLVIPETVAKAVAYTLGGRVAIDWLRAGGEEGKNA